MAKNGSLARTTHMKSGKASKKLATATVKDNTAGAASTLNVQQKCLDIFRDRLQPSNDDNSTLQEVKGHLFNRDFATAFGKEEYLRVYAWRWSPSRALAYSNAFAELHSTFDIAGGVREATDSGGVLRVVCIGGGAGGELVGLGAWANLAAQEERIDQQLGLQVDLVDVADWTAVNDQLYAGLTAPPPLSKYASQAKKDANKPLVSGSEFKVNFHQQDVLAVDPVKQTTLVNMLDGVDMLTFMFTLNELYSASLSATQALLLRITDAVKIGSHLLVVDSPGSYATVALNGAEKRYPMQWLLDHTLLGSGGGQRKEASRWDKVLEDESRWFRLNKALAYPIALEDMRFQMHLFRRVG